MDQRPDATIDHLLAELQSNDEAARSAAAFTLVLLNDPTDRTRHPAVEPLTRLLGHPQADVRMRAAWALGHIGAPALPMLLELSAGTDQRLRTEAIRVLGVIGEARTLNHLLAALTDQTVEVATRAARAIGKIGDPRAYHPLVTALNHPAPDMRYEVCRALADLRIADAAPLLRQLAATDTATTSWGAPIAEAARRAAEDVERAPGQVFGEEFARASELVQRQQREHAAGQSPQPADPPDD